MGAIRSRFARAVRLQFETEARMHKVIEKEKPVQAPRHPTTVPKYDKMITENPSLQNVSKSRDDNLLNMLSGLKVDSIDIKEKPLPGSFPSRDKRKIVPGTLSAYEMLELFDRQSKSPEEWTADKLSKHYRLEKELVDNLLKYYSSFNIIKPEKPPMPLDKVSLP